MIAFGLLSLVGGVVLALAGPALARLLSGRTATLMLTLAALLTALATGLVLCAAGCLALAQLPAFAALGRWSAPAVASRAPLPTWAAIACGTVAIGLVALAAVRLARGMLALRRSASVCRALPDTAGGLVILDDSTADAYALAGRPGRVVVTRPLLRMLTAPQRRAVLAHERAHLRHRHYLYVQAIDLAVAADPVLWPLRRAVRGAIERWADEEAVTHVGSHLTVAEALAHLGLTRVGAQLVRPVVALAIGESVVGERIRALGSAAPARPARLLAVTALAVLGIACAAAGCVFGMYAHDIVEWAQTVAGRR